MTRLLFPLDFMESARFFVFKHFFKFLCYKVGIKTSVDEITLLGKSKELKLWIKTIYQIAFYPKKRLELHALTLEKSTKQSINSDSIGPGREFLSWFQNLYSDETTDNSVLLTKKQRGFVYALSNKLDTHSPNIVFEMLKSPKLVDAWFTIAKILADRPFEKLSRLFETLSTQTSFDLHERDLLNSKTMIGWLQNCLQSGPDHNEPRTVKKNQLNTQNWNVQAQYYFVCESTTVCWKCSQIIPVYAVAVPSESATWWEVDGRVAGMQEKHPGIMKYITEFSENPFQPDNAALHSVLYKDFSKSANLSYWMNHCIHCSTKQGDNALHHPGEAFWPLSIPAAKQLKVYRYLRPISARCELLEFLCLEDIPEVTKEMVH